MLFRDSNIINESISVSISQLTEITKPQYLKPHVLVVLFHHQPKVEKVVPKTTLRKTQIYD